MHGWVGGSVGKWMGSGHITKYQIKLDLIEIIQFCLKIYVLLRHPTMGGYMGGSVGQWVGLGNITKYQIKLELIEIIQFCFED